MGWTCSTQKVKSTYKILVRKSEGKRPLGGGLDVCGRLILK